MNRAMYGIDFKAVKPVEAIKDTACPVFIIVGGAGRYRLLPNRRSGYIRLLPIRRAGYGFFPRPNIPVLILPVPRNTWKK
jgi:hypothetical protein